MLYEKNLVKLKCIPVRYKHSERYFLTNMYLCRIYSYRDGRIEVLYMLI